MFVLFLRKPQLVRLSHLGCTHLANATFILNIYLCRFSLAAAAESTCSKTEISEHIKLFRFYDNFEVMQSEILRRSSDS